jgi:LuxR family transcriptional regulator, maltose regulon positive regulatory protein
MTTARAQGAPASRTDVRLLASGFPVLETKLVPPPPRAGLLRRDALIDRLVTSSEVPVVAVVAPAGYGKSTLLAQWSESDPRHFAWLQIDERDNDPSVLLAYIAFALGGASALGPEVAEALASPGPSVWTVAVPRLGAALAAQSPPFVLVLDDVDRLTESDPADILVALASHLHGGSQFVLAGRSPGRLPIPRILAGGRGTLIDTSDLQLSDDDAGAVLLAAGVDLPAGEVSAINRSTEGWPAGLYLTALSIRSKRNNGRTPIRASPLTDQLVGDYIRTEILSRLTSDDLGFLLDASALERFSGPLCDSVMERKDSGARLDELARANLLLIPLDDRQEWYRYHTLLRDHLLTELRRRDEPRVRALHARAAAWHGSHADDETALEYAMLAGDIDQAAQLLPQLAQRAYNSGRVGSLRRWFEAMDQGGVPLHHSDVAVVGAILFSLLDDPAQADHWAQYLSDSPPDSAPDVHATAMLRFGRAFLCRSGVEQMRADAEAAADAFPEDDQWRPLTLLSLGVGELGSTGTDQADATFEAAVRSAQKAGIAQGTAAAALVYRAVIAMGRGDWDAASRFVAEARAEVDAGRVGEQVPGVLTDAVDARVAIHRGDPESARAHLAHAQRLRPLLTRALPWVAVRARLDLAHAHLALADAPGARTLLAEIRDVLARRPRLGALVDEVATIQRQVDTMRGDVIGASTLTTAELRLLPLLTTHLSFREIGTQLFVSHNTVKTQAISIYRKLDASSRSEAIERAVQVGLLESTAPAHQFIPSG